MGLLAGIDIGRNKYMRWTGCKRKRLILHIIWKNRNGKPCRSVERYHIYVFSSKRTLEGAWKSTGDRLQLPNYLKRVDHDRKIRNRKERTDIGKYSLVNSTIRIWNRLPAQNLGTLPCKPNAFRKSVTRVINVVNWRKYKCVENYLKVQWIGVKWSEV